MSKPKVLRIINRLNLGGPTYNAAYLTRYLSPEFETLFIAGNKDETEASSEFIVENLGLKARYINGMYRSLNPFKDYKAYLEIKAIIKEFKPDIVHTHAAKAGALGRLAAIHAGVPVIVHTFHGHVFHSYFNSIVNRVFVGIERYLAKKSTAIIAISALQKKELTVDFEICAADKVTVVPLGFDLERFQKDKEVKRQQFRSSYGLTQQEVAIGIIGRLVPIKNHAFFLEVVKEVIAGVQQPVRFFIIGDGEDRALVEQQAQTLNIAYESIHWNDETLNTTQTIQHTETKLVFTSWMQNIPIALAGLDLVVMTSLNEGTPVSLIEALAAGKPVVSTNVGGVANVVQDGTTGFLTKTDELKIFSQHVKNLVANRGLREQMGNKGYESVAAKYGYARLVEDVRTLYHQLLSKTKEA
jgi:glycosyltransferase involved in cell wall biosynthesis